MFIELPTQTFGCELPEQFADGLWYIKMLDFPAYLGILIGNVTLGTAYLLRATIQTAMKKLIVD